MPKYTELWNQHIAVQKGTEIDQQATAENNGSPVVAEVWKLVFTDTRYGDTMVISFRKDTRDDIVRQLTGGIVLAGGDLPSV